MTTDTTGMKGFVAFYAGNDRNPLASKEPTQITTVYDDMASLKEWHRLATGYIDLSRIPSEAVEFRR